MKTDKAYSETAHREIGVNVEALLAAIENIAQGEVNFSGTPEDPQRVNVDWRTFHTWGELAEAFELDIHDFSVSEINR